MDRMVAHVHARASRAGGGEAVGLLRRLGLRVAIASSSPTG